MMHAGKAMSHATSSTVHSVPAPCRNKVCALGHPPDRFYPPVPSCNTFRILTVPFLMSRQVDPQLFPLPKSLICFLYLLQFLPMLCRVLTLVRCPCNKRPTSSPPLLVDATLLHRRKYGSCFFTCSTRSSNRTIASSHQVESHMSYIRSIGRIPHTCPTFINIFQISHRILMFFSSSFFPTPCASTVPAPEAKAVPTTFPFILSTQFPLLNLLFSTVLVFASSLETLTKCWLELGTGSTLLELLSVHQRRHKKVDKIQREIPNILTLRLMAGNGNTTVVLAGVRCHVTAGAAPTANHQKNTESDPRDLVQNGHGSA